MKVIQSDPYRIEKINFSWKHHFFRDDLVKIYLHFEAAITSFTSLIKPLICWLVFCNSLSCAWRFSRKYGLSVTQSVNSRGCNLTTIFTNSRYLGDNDQLKGDGDMKMLTKLNSPVSRSARNVTGTSSRQNHEQENLKVFFHLRTTQIISFILNEQLLWSTNK